MFIIGIKKTVQTGGTQSCVVQVINESREIGDTLVPQILNLTI